jgi:hypothetical protein
VIHREQPGLQSEVHRVALLPTYQLASVLRAAIARCSETPETLSASGLKTDRVANESTPLEEREHLAMSVLSGIRTLAGFCDPDGAAEIGILVELAAQLDDLRLCTAGVNICPPDAPSHSGDER